MSTGHSDAAFQEAEAVIQAQSNQAAKGERRLNTFGEPVLLYCTHFVSPRTSSGNVASRVSNSSLVSAAQSDAASQTFALVKDQVSNFAHHSKVLMDVLDEVAKAHPFIRRKSVELLA